MSAIITGRVFWTKFSSLSYNDAKKKKVTIKETTAKIVLLAISDSSDDFGENSWQSFETIAQKTSLERRSVIRVVRALIENDYIKVAGLTPYGTNNFSINLNLLGFPPIKRAKAGRPKKGDSVAFTDDSETETSDSETETSDSDAETSDLKSPDPLINHPKPSKEKEGASAKLKGSQIPEVALYREVTNLYPTTEVYGEVVESVQKIKDRLGRDVTKDDLLPFRKAWVSKGYNRFAITWLEWAETGSVPKNDSWRSRRETTPPESVGTSIARSWLAKKKQELAHG
jgi:hypothetical protein